LFGFLLKNVFAHTTKAFNRYNIMIMRSRYIILFHYRPVGVLGQAIGHNGTSGTAADHHEVVLVPDLGDPAVRQPVIDVLDVGPEEQYGHADEHYVADAGPVRHGDSGGQPGRERVRRHARRRRPLNGHCR